MPSDADDVEIVDIIQPAVSGTHFFLFLSRMELDKHFAFFFSLLDPAQPGPSGTRTAATASTSSARIMDADDVILIVLIAIYLLF